ncbi:MAG: DUF924 domain-containing protein [Pseudomonadota bacterium]|nr:DUF924 domain-containing protein [Pseudomonadota bacterium]
MDYQTVMDFWFRELQPKQWWVRDAALDAQIRQRFTALHAAAAAGELFHWRRAAAGRLAEVIVLDQFSRNMFRDTAQAFATDALALVLAQEAVAAAADQQLPVQQRVFFYMPYMHSESLRIHDEALTLFSQPGLESNLDFEHRHRTILERFGRYPHRNAILGRDSSAAETAFLTQPGSSF